jgi:hypothetical protein
MFNNKFSRLLPHPGYNVGGGIGEAALLGAAFGGAKGLVTGENILESALVGGATGALTGGIFGGAPDVAATTVADEAQKQAAEAALTGGVGIGHFGVNEGVKQSLTDFGAYGAKDFMSAVDPGGLNAALNVAPQATQTAGLAAFNPNATSMMQNLGTTAAPVAEAIQAPVELGTEVFNPALAQEEILKQAAYNPTQTTGIRGMLDVKPGSMTSNALDYWDKQDTLGKAGISALGGATYGALTAPTPEIEPIKKQESKLAGYDPQRFTPYMPAQPNPYYRAQYAAQGGVMNSYAQGGIAALAQGGMGNNLNFPQGRQDATQYATPTQLPASASVINADYEAATDPYSGSPLKMAGGGMAGMVFYDPDKGQYYTTKQGLFNPVMGFNMEREYIGVNPAGADTMADFKVSQATPNVYQQEQYAPTAMPSVPQAMPSYNYSLADSLPLLQATNPGIAAMYATPSAPVEEKAQGGIAGYSLGGYAAGGNPRLLKGPGDGMSDDIPATIGNRQPARLADGEFVVPADVVSHLGNGSTDAGAKHLYKMMDKVRKARTGSKKQGKQIKPAKFMPA